MLGPAERLVNPIHHQRRRQAARQPQRRAHRPVDHRRVHVPVDDRLGDAQANRNEHAGDPKGEDVGNEVFPMIGLLQIIESLLFFLRR